MLALEIRKLTHDRTQVTGINGIGSVTSVSTGERVVPFVSDSGACRNIDDSLVIGGHKRINTAIALSNAYK